MKFGLDIIELAHKGCLDQIILIAGDSEFVPAAKLAGKKGIDMVLDSMRQPMSDERFGRADGVRSTGPKPKPKAG